MFYSVPFDVLLSFTTEWVCNFQLEHKRKNTEITILS